jgi:PAS domain S-box-containing protein
MNGHRGHGPKADLVLVADDDFTIRLLCREALEGAGYAVAEADSGEEALERFGRLGPDLVLLDVMMAGMDGFGTLEAIRRDPERGNVPVVMITGLEDASAIKRAYETGATNFITKPINWANLRHQVRYILRASRTAEDLRRSRETLANAQRIARLGSWDWDVSRDRMTGSEELFEILGLSSADFAGTLASFLALIHAEDRDRVHEALEGAPATHGVFSIDHRVEQKGGESLIAHTQGRLTCDIHARTIVMSGTTQDITALKAMEHRLVESERLSAMGEMAGEIGHELNNYLAAIGGRADLIPMALEQDNLDLARKGARVVAEQIDKMRVLTDGLLESARCHRSPQETDLNDVIQRTLDLVQPQNKYDRIKFDVTLHSSAPTVYIDPQQLQQVILNLLSNGADAVQAKEDGGRLWVESFAGGNEAMLRVRDDGSGIPPDLIARIFEPRFTTKATGHGFGLAVCHRIVTSHGGRIELESRPGEGTTFTVHFPLCVADDRSGPRPRHAVLATNPRASGTRSLPGPVKAPADRPV